MKEWQRTVLLILMLLAALAFIFWMRHQYDANFTQAL